MAVLQIVTLLLGVTVAFGRQCDLGWTLFKGECLYFSHDRKSWTDAETKCHGMDHGYLVTVDNEAKSNFINMILKAVHHVREYGFWFGGSDYAIEGQWRWLETGKAIGPYSSWGAGYPDGNKTHNCLLQQFQGDTSIWIDSNCARSHYYVCEKPAMGNPGNPV